ncbi:MAG: DUF433 domain-containing protein [Bordetella sp.]|nr:DUF433 domain-containing protein [Bordetella sp.]
MILSAFVPVAEAAFIGNVTASQLNRLVDENLVPEPLLLREQGRRRHARLLAALAGFFFESETVLTQAARTQVLATLMRRIAAAPRPEAVLALCDTQTIDWRVALPGAAQIVVDLSLVVARAVARAGQVDRARALIVARPDTLGGAPCFAGTRIPLQVVQDSLAQAISSERLLAAYPALTPAHLEAARLLGRIAPARGRPRRLKDHFAAEPVAPRIETADAP